MSRCLPMIPLAAIFVAGTAFADPRSEMIDAFQKAMQDGSYSMQMVTDGKKSHQMQMEVQLPDRFHMTTPESEMIILPGGTWMKAGGRWMKMPMNMSKLTKGFSEQAAKEGIDSLKDVQYLGEETIAGCSSRHYSYAVKGQFMGINADSIGEAWICADDGLPIQVKSTHKGDTATLRYDFDAEVNIRPPN